VAAGDPTRDPIQVHWIPPELLIQHREGIGLTDQQIEIIETRLEEAGPIVERYQARLSDAMGKLAQLLAVTRVDEEAALKQLDEVLRIEKEMKRAHLSVMIQIRNALSAEQQAIAVELKRRSQSARDTEQRIKHKITRTEQDIRARAQAGHPPHDIIESLHQEVPALVKMGHIKEAEALLDRLLARLGGSSQAQKPKDLSRYRRETEETQYLILPVREAGQLYGGQTAPVDRAIKDTAQMLGQAENVKKRNWGFHLIIPAWRFDPEHSENRHADIAKAVHGAFDLAIRNDVAVHLTVDSHEWSNRPDLWNYADEEKPGYDPKKSANVEWSDWGGTPHPHRYRNWGTPEAMPPVICYNSPTVLREVSRLIGDVVAPPITAGLERLRKEGKEHLFSGLTVGAEPSLPNYENIDRLRPQIARLMDQDGSPKTRLGYNALSNNGYSKATPPEDFGRALAQVNDDYTSYWSQKLAEAGIPTEKMYTHVAAGAGVIGSPGVEFTNAPISIAFNDLSRPGWTTYPVGPFRNGFEILYKHLELHGNPHWASTEAAPAMGPAGGGLTMKEYLVRHYDYGATVMVFNTGATSKELTDALAEGVWGEAAIEAYREFLGPRLE
jgi:Spy/CpxP family protein refolding chaperone